jgi:hypothetical protein
VILVLAADHRADEARAILDSQLTPEAWVRWCTCERLVEVAAIIPALDPWVRWFRERYLDLSPVQGHS